MWTTPFGAAVDAGREEDRRRIVARSGPARRQSAGPRGEQRRARSSGRAGSSRRPRAAPGSRGCAATPRRRAPDAELRQAGGVVVAQEAARRDQHGDVGERERVRQLARAVERVQRHEHAAAAPHAEGDREPLRPVRQQQPDVRARPTPRAASAPATRSASAASSRKRKPAARRHERLAVAVVARRARRAARAASRGRVSRRPSAASRGVCRRTSRRCPALPARDDGRRIRAPRCDAARRWRLSASRSPRAARWHEPLHCAVSSRATTGGRGRAEARRDVIRFLGRARHERVRVRPEERSLPSRPLARALPRRTRSPSCAPPPRWRDARGSASSTRSAPRSTSATPATTTSRR